MSKTDGMNWDCGASGNTITATTPKACNPANDNVRFRGGYPALNWLAKHSIEAARAVAERLFPPTRQVAVLGMEDELHEAGRLEIRPTVEELLRAAGDAQPRRAGSGVVELGSLRFQNGHLLEYGRTAFGRPLRPVERVRVTLKPPRDPSRYLALPGAAQSPMHVGGLQRPMSGAPAIPPIEVPADKAAARAMLAVLMMDAPPGTRCPSVVAKGALFMGGVSASRGNTTPPAINWEPPEVERLTGESERVLEEIAARGTLTSVGKQLGYHGGAADRAGGRAVLAAARELSAANDNFGPPVPNRAAPERIYCKR